MDSNLNLDLDAYSVAELRDLLSVKEGDGEDKIRSARDAIRDQLAEDGAIPPDKINEIGLFLDSAFSRLCNYLTNTPSLVKIADNKDGTWSQPQNGIIQQGGHVLIDNPDEIAGRNASITGGRAATSGEAPPGYLNPINVRTLMQAVNVDSRFRPNYFKTLSTDFTIMLPEEIKKVVSMRVATIELPLTYYSISQAQGNAHMLLVQKDSSKATLVRLPDGNYEPFWSPKADAASIESAMNQAIADGIEGSLDSNNTFTPDPGPPEPCTPSQNPESSIFTVDQASGRSVFQSNDYTSLRFNVDQNGNLDTSTNLQLRLGWALGYRAAEYFFNTDEQGTANAIASEAPCNISSPRYGFLAIDDHQRNACTSFLVSYGESSLDANIITRINLSSAMAADGAFRSAESPGLSTELNRTREYFGPVNIQRLDIRLYDEYGRIIDLNNTDWSFSLAFEKLYD